MIYILLATITSVLMLVIVRLFEKTNAHTLYALLFNYLSAFVCGLLNRYLYLPDTSFSLSKEAWILTATEGILFITVFYWIAQTTKYYGIAVTSVANKMSLIFPVLSAHFIFGEPLGLYRWIGLSMAILSFWLTTYSNTDKPYQYAGKIFFPILVFVGSGIIDTLINYGNKTSIDTPGKQMIFTTFVYGFALITGFVYLKADHQKIFYKENFNWKSTFILGSLLGIPNFYNLFFIIQALNAHIFPSGQIFLILNLSNVITTAIVGLLIFKEKLNWINWLGMVCAVLAIFLVQ